MNRKLKTTGFTIAELLTVVAVLAILIGILMPALNQAKKMASKTKQKAQLQSIDIAINLYKNDFGDYPESGGSGITYLEYCGSQKLAEAIFGYDLLGFHKDSIFDVDGKDDNGTNLYPDSDPALEDSLNFRKGPYLQSDTTVTFTLNDLFGTNPHPTTSLNMKRYFICDTYTFKKVTIPGSTKVLKAGTPILYYRANPQNIKHDYQYAKDSIYNYNDNSALTSLNFRANIDDHLFKGTTSAEFYTFIKDPVKSKNRDWPVRMDTFLLISAGDDGRYGTSDDICNFEPNFE